MNIRDQIGLTLFELLGEPLMHLRGDFLFDGGKDEIAASSFAVLDLNLLFLVVQSPSNLDRTSPGISDVTAILSFNSCPAAIGEDSRAAMEGILELRF